MVNIITQGELILCVLSEHLPVSCNTYSFISLLAYCFVGDPRGGGDDSLPPPPPELLPPDPGNFQDNAIYFKQSQVSALSVCY